MCASRRLWKTVDRRTLHSARNEDEISVVIDTVEVSPGNSFEYVNVVSPYEFVCVVGHFGSGKILMGRQYRYLVQDELLEVPAGSPQGTETLAVAANRELTEETGYSSGQLRRLGSFYASVGITNQVFHVFLAENLRLEGTAAHDEREEIQVHIMDLDVAIEALLGSSVSNGPSVLALLVVKRFLADSTERIVAEPLVE